MERYETLELQVITFEVDDVLQQPVRVAGGGSAQAIAGGGAAGGGQGVIPGGF